MNEMTRFQMSLLTDTFRDGWKFHIWASLAMVPGSFALASLSGGRFAFVPWLAGSFLFAVSILFSLKLWEPRHFAVRRVPDYAVNAQALDGMEEETIAALTAMHREHRRLARTSRYLTPFVGVASGLLLMAVAFTQSDWGAALIGVLGTVSGLGLNFGNFRMLANEKFGHTVTALALHASLLDD